MEVAIREIILRKSSTFVSNAWSFQIMEGQRFCGVEDEDRGEVIFFRLSNTCHSDVLLQFVPVVPFQIQKLSDAMHNEDKEEGMVQLREVLAFLGLPR